MLIPVYVISLQGSARRPLMQAHLDGLAVAFRFFDAIRGADLPSEVLRTGAFLGRRSGTISAGERGLIISYVAVLKVIAKGDDPFVCVLEDDARFIGEIGLLQRERVKALPAFDVLRLARMPNEPRRRQRAISPGVAAIDRGHDGNSGQIISREGAARLIKHLVPIRAPIDHVIYHDPPFGFRLLAAVPPIVEDANLPTTLGHSQADMKGTPPGRWFTLRKWAWHIPRRLKRKLSFELAWRSR